MRDRYSSMKDFSSLIKKSMPIKSFQELPHFPPKKFLGNKGEGFLKSRMKQLENFFNNFLGNTEVAKNTNVLIYFREKAVEKEKVNELADFLEKKTKKQAGGVAQQQPVMNQLGTNQGFEPTKPSPAENLIV